MTNKLQTKQDSPENVNNMSTISPYVDIFESANDITLIVDLPGVDKKSLNLEFENNEIHISGESKAPEPAWKSHFREFRVNRFERGFKLPSGLEISKISADFENGVLTVTIPKSESEKPHKIKIKSK